MSIGLWSLRGELVVGGDLRRGYRPYEMRSGPRVVFVWLGLVRLGVRG